MNKNKELFFLVSKGVSLIWNSFLFYLFVKFITFEKNNTMSQKRLFLLDAYALIFRGYYAFIKNPRINSKGMDTSAIMGFMNALMDEVSIPLELIRGFFIKA